MTIARQMLFTISLCSGRKHNNLPGHNPGRVIETGGIRTNRTSTIDR
jgi:hypothetical protein